MTQPQPPKWPTPDPTKSFVTDDGDTLIGLTREEWETADRERQQWLDSLYGELTVTEEIARLDRGDFNELETRRLGMFNDLLAIGAWSPKEVAVMVATNARLDREALPGFFVLWLCKQGQ